MVIRLLPDGYQRATLRSAQSRLLVLKGSGCAVVGIDSISIELPSWIPAPVYHTANRVIFGRRLNQHISSHLVVPPVARVCRIRIDMAPVRASGCRV